jgi:hypothetical protein
MARRRTPAPRRALVFEKLETIRRELSELTPDEQEWLISEWGQIPDSPIDRLNKEALELRNRVAAIAVRLGDPLVERVEELQQEIGRRTVKPWNVERDRIIARLRDGERISFHQIGQRLETLGFPRMNAKAVEKAYSRSKKRPR